jgi:hypothetical protein
MRVRMHTRTNQRQARHTTEHSSVLTPSSTDREMKVCWLRSRAAAAAPQQREAQQQLQLAIMPTTPPQVTLARGHSNPLPSLNQ